MAVSVNSRLFREYIGTLGNGVNFPDVPVNSGVDFHFILAFAADADADYTGRPATLTSTNGLFNIFWDNDNLTPAAVNDIKRRRSNVKVALSLGSASVNDRATVVFTAIGVDSWVRNAVSSLTPIIQQYHIDGIDIHYEHFSDSPSSVYMFVECIGRLITALKDEGVISFASTAPYDEPSVQRHYMSLWHRYASVIDYVNFKFHAYDPGMTVPQFLRHHEQQRQNYNGGKVLASFMTVGKGGLPPANGFFDACMELLQVGGQLPGVFAWSADTSFGHGNGFVYEMQAQQLLANGAIYMQK